MQISQHYLPYPKKTLIVVTNNELAKVLWVHDREIDELLTMEMPKDDGDFKATGTPHSAAPDFDEMKKHKLQELYTKLNKKLIKLLNDEYEEIVLCAPEAKKNELVEGMHPDVMKCTVEIVPKNLASLPLDAIVRILQETRAT